MLLLIHIFRYVPIIYANVHIPMLCHLLLISIVLIIYAFLSCVHSTFHLIPFWYVYHILISFTYSCHLFLACSIYSYKYIYHIILYSYHIHIFLFLYESILFRNWNQSNRIIQNKVMAFSFQLVILPIFLGTVYVTHFPGS